VPYIKRYSDTQLGRLGGQGHDRGAARQGLGLNALSSSGKAIESFFFYGTSNSQYPQVTFFLKVISPNCLFYLLQLIRYV